MKLVTFTINRDSRIGALETRDGQDVLIDLNRADPRLPTDMIQFLAGGLSARALAAEALAQAESEHELELSAVRLKAPVPRPGKIICIGLT